MYAMSQPHTAGLQPLQTPNFFMALPFSSDVPHCPSGNGVALSDYDVTSSRQCHSPWVWVTLLLALQALETQPPHLGTAFVVFSQPPESSVWGLIPGCCQQSMTLFYLHSQF